VSRQIARLEELELIERTTDPADARARALDLTAQGRSRLQAVRLARRDRFRSLVSTWPRADVAELARLLGELNRVL
jgi:DNA-binding MarR family transcriptional regulator